MAEKTTQADTNAYVERVNRAIDFVIRNLDQPLQLDSVADEAGFSPFHFHRVFRSLVGETLNEFIKRLRLERALGMMSHAGKRSLTDIAFACGFGSSSDFSRAFKKRYGVPPSAFDVNVFRASRREEWQAVVAGADRRHLLDGLPAGENPDAFEARIRDLPARTVAYIRVPDSYSSLDAVISANDRLLEWAEARGLADGQWLGYMWDDPEIVDPKLCRYDVAVEVPQFEPEGEIGRYDFPPMRVAEVEIRGGIDLEMRALDWIFKTWLPASEHVPAAHPCFEAWIGRPFAHGFEHFELHAHIPIERA